MLKYKNQLLAVVLSLLLVSLSGCNNTGRDAVLKTLKECEVGNKVVMTTKAGTFGSSVSISCEWIKKAN